MYYPYQKGRYEVAPGLLPFGKDFGNGKLDQLLFQIGDDFKLYRSQIDENRFKEDVEKYVCLAREHDPKAVGEIACFMARKLAEEYPHAIRAQVTGNIIEFESDFTGEAFRLHADTNEVELIRTEHRYGSAWDAIGSQVPEDLAIWTLREDGSEFLEALHLNAPNFWAAKEKIGQSFAAVHKPVAHIEKIVPWAVNLFDGIIKKGPYTRFAWGVGTDHRLNHHPEPAPGVEASAWAGRRFNPAKPELHARVERQVLWGFPEKKRVLFTIRTYFHDVQDLRAKRPDALKGLVEAIRTMTPEALVYKGLNQDQKAVIHWLEGMMFSP